MIPARLLFKVRVAPGAAVPENVGVVSAVLLSVFDFPVSDALVKSGLDGGDWSLTIVKKPLFAVDVPFKVTLIR